MLRFVCLLLVCQDPELWELDRFPGAECISELLNWQLELYNSLYRSGDITGAAEMNKLRNAWNCLYQARRVQPGRRACLAAFRDSVGLEAFYSGCVPICPVDRMQKR